MGRKLPRVTKETGYAVCRELEQEEDNNYIIKLLEKLGAIYDSGLGRTGESTQTT